MPDQLTLGKLITTEDTNPIDTDFAPTIKANGDGRRVAMPVLLRQLKRGEIYIASADESDAAYADYICNGSTDGQVIINGIDALPNTGRGKIKLSGGTFGIEKTITYNEDTVTLEGVGGGERPSLSAGVGTTLKVLSGFVGTEVIKVEHRLGTRPCGQARLIGFSIAGESLNNASAGAINGIHFSAFHGRMRDVWINEVSGYGVYMKRTGATWNTYDTQLWGVHVDRAALAGYVLDAGATDVHMIGCFATNGAGDGIEFRLDTGGFQGVNCHFYDNQRYGIWFNPGGSVSHWANCKIENSRQHGVFFDNTSGGPSDVKFSNCNFRKNGRGGATNQYHNVYLKHTVGNGISRTLFTGCHFKADGMNNTADLYKPGYHLNLEGSTAQDTRITNCAFDDNFQTGKINDVGTRTLINGIGRNGGNPASAGGWNGVTEEGIIVRDTTNSITYMYRNGGWFTL